MALDSGSQKSLSNISNSLAAVNQNLTKLNKQLEQQNKLLLEFVRVYIKKETNDG